MTPTIYQKPEIRDANDNIIQQGAFGKNTALANATNDGWIDYVANDLNFLYDLAKDEVVPVSALPASGDMNKTYLLTTTGVCYRWDGTEWVEISSSEAVGRAETAANLAEQWATKTNGTVDGTEYSAKHYANAAQQSADDAQDVADDMATHLSQIDQNTGGISANSKRIGNIEKLLQGNLYDYDTDSSSAYTKTVPSGAMPYAGIEQIGGKTVVWNQLRRDSDVYGTKNNVKTEYDSTTHLVSITNIGRTSNFITGDNGIILNPGRYLIHAGHKYIVLTDENSNALGVSSGSAGPEFLGDVNSVFTMSSSVQNIYLWIKNSYDFVNDHPINDVYSFHVNIYDLTLMFGSGNEPTADEVRAMFPPSIYYAYNAGTLLSAGVTEVVSKDSNNATLQTIPIPTAIRNLEGYGWSAGTAYNYIDFEAKKFVKNVGNVDLGSLSWIYYGNNLFSANLADQKKTGYVLCSDYTYSDAARAEGMSDKTVCNKYYAFSPENLIIKDTAYSDTTTFTSALNGVYAYYELATPVEVDISDYLTDDNLINVESGGTLTFPNSNGTDYQIPVPSEEEYMIDLQSAL